MGGTGSVGGVTVEWAAATDVGLVRHVNEDALLAELPVFVVADGMGGHRAGDVASELVVERFALLADGRLPAMTEVMNSINDLNIAIRNEGMSSAERSGMGTTAVGLLLVDNGSETGLLLFNVGDSRAYCATGGVLTQLSVDHSYVQELVDAGEISSVEARAHPQRNVVTRALGADTSVDADYWLRVPAVGERFLLCSDGLNSEIDDTMIAEALSGDVSVDDAARVLVEGALNAGGKDNVTVLVVDVLKVDSGDECTGDTEPGRRAAKSNGTISSEETGSGTDPTEPIIRIVPATVSGPPVANEDESVSAGDARDTATVANEFLISDVPGVALVSSDSPQTNQSLLDAGQVPGGGRNKGSRKPTIEAEADDSTSHTTPDDGANAVPGDERGTNVKTGEENCDE